MQLLVAEDEALAEHWRQFGQWLKIQREAVPGLSSTRAAERAGIHITTWSRLENGQTGTRRNTLPRILHAVGIEPRDKLFTDGHQMAGFVPPTGEVVFTTVRSANQNNAFPEKFEETFYPDDVIDLPAYEAFLLGLPRTMQQAEFERMRALWLQHRRGLTDFGKKAEVDEE